MSPKLSGRLFGSIRGCALRWFSSDIGCPLKSLLPRIRWGNIDIKKCQAVSRMQSKVETNLQPQSGGSLRGATNLISYFPPLWRDTNSDIKHCPLGLSNRSKDNSGKTSHRRRKQSAVLRQNYCFGHLHHLYWMHFCSIVMGLNWIQWSNLKYFKHEKCNHSNNNNNNKW